MAADALRDELAGPSPTPLERLLVDRVVLGYHADAAAAQAAGRELTPAQLGHLQKRQERAQRSYLAAVKALAVVRKLMQPAGAACVVENRRPVGAADPKGSEGHDGPPSQPEEVPSQPRK